MLIDLSFMTLALVGTYDDRFALPAVIIEHMQRLVNKERIERIVEMNKQRWRIMNESPWLVKFCWDGWRHWRHMFVAAWDASHVPWAPLTFWNLSLGDDPLHPTLYSWSTIELWADHVSFARPYGPGFYGGDMIGFDEEDPIRFFSDSIPSTMALPAINPIYLPQSLRGANTPPYARLILSIFLDVVCGKTESMDAQEMWLTEAVTSCRPSPVQLRENLVDQFVDYSVDLFVE
tara:strand:- start:882 stop:1580 length:699 start_codon:yes stop_codon:yes gene_type:complete